MKQAVRVALIQLAWAGAREPMLVLYRQLIGHAAMEGATLICLPELSLSPYFPGTRTAAGFEWAEALEDGPTAQFCGALAREHHVTIVGSIFEQTPEGRYFDTATLYNPQGQLAGYTRKIHIPSGTGYHETDFFEGGQEYPVFDMGTLRLATPTCYDQWFPELARIYTLNGAEFIFYPTAIGSEPTDPDIDTQEAWQTVMRGHAIANGVFIGAANRVGMENGVRFYGSSFICDPTGAILVQAGRDTTEVIMADLMPHTLEHWRDLFPLLHQRKPATYQRLTEKTGGKPPDWLNHP